MTSSSDQQRSESSHFYRLAQSEQAKAGELQRGLLNVENALRVIAGEKGELVKDIQ